MPAERRRDRPHVRPRADAKVERATPSAIRDDFERVHLRTPHRHLHLHPAPREPVGTLTADLHRRHGRDRQLDLAAEFREPLLQLAGRRRRVPLEDVSLRIAGRRRRREIDVRDVTLVQSDEAWLQLGRPARQHDEQAGRERVERAGVTGTRAGPPAQLGDHLEGRRPRRLVDRTTPAGSSARGTTRGDVLASDELGDLLDRLLAREAGGLAVPAAADCRAIAETSTSSVLERSDTRLVGPSERGGSRISTETIAPSTARR